MNRLFLLLIFFSLNVSGQSTVLTKIVGQWRNCGTITAESKSILLFKSKSTCDTTSKDCVESKWEFSIDTLNSKNCILNILTGTCTTGKFVLANFLQEFQGIKWDVDEKNKLLILNDGTEKKFKIILLDSYKMELKRI